LHRPAAIIFDMDGLIFDTEALYLEAFLTNAQANGHEALDEAMAHSLVGLSWAATREKLLPALGNGKAVDEFGDQWLQRYSTLAETELELKPGVMELLDSLDGLEIPRAVATSTGRSIAESHLSGHGLLHRFSAVITIDECTQGKPHPEPYLNAARALSTAPSACWALEDSPNGIRAAQAASMSAIMIPDLIQPDWEIRAICAYVLDTLHDVRALLVPEG
jgi:HAD superfamily hydrolase (TIGR01509 family)